MIDATPIISQGGNVGLLTALCIAIAAMASALGWLATRLYSRQEDHTKALSSLQTKQTEDLMKVQQQATSDLSKAQQQAASDLAKVQEARIVEMASITKAAETLNSAIDLLTRRGSK